jgi:hypothetical protein
VLLAEIAFRRRASAEPYPPLILDNARQRAVAESPAPPPLIRAHWCPFVDNPLRTLAAPA